MNKYCPHNRIIEQAKFTYSGLGKAFEKQRKTMKSNGKQSEAFESLDSNDWQIQIHQPLIKPIEDLILKAQLNQEATNELQKFVKTEQKIYFTKLVIPKKIRYSIFENSKLCNLLG